jgi:hypothetical protein
MPFPDLFEQLLRDEGLTTLRERATEGVLMVDKYGTNEWRFASGLYSVTLDFVGRRVVVAHATKGNASASLDQFLSHLDVSY